MKLNITLICTVIAVFLLVACNPQNQAPALLREAQSLVEDRPDSALKLIDSIFYPEKSLKKKEYMEYVVTRVQARRKTQIPVKDDTLIFKAIEYFSHNNKEARNASLATFYGGSVYREQKNYEKAMHLYKEAVSYALTNKDLDLQGLIHYNIGDLFSEEGLYTNALHEYEEAERLYGSSKQVVYHKRAQCFSAIGRMHLLLGNVDDALSAFYCGFKLAESANDIVLQSLLTQNLSIAYSEIKQYKQAENYLFKSFVLNQNVEELPRYYLNFAKLYQFTKQADSVVVYVNYLKQEIELSNNLYLKASAYDFLAEWEKQQGRYDEAFLYQNQRMEVLTNIMENRNKQSVYAIQQKYDFEKYQNRYNQKFVLYQRWIINLLIILIIGGVLISLFVSRHKRIRQLAMQKIATLKEMNRDLEISNNQKRQDLRKQLLWRFDVAKKVLEMNKSSISQKEKIMLQQLNRTLYGDTNSEERWDILFHTFNDTLPGFADKIRETYPDLTESEFRICLLTYSGFRVKEIALILEQSHNTIQTRRTQLRKKIGLERGVNLADFLDKTINI